MSQALCHVFCFARVDPVLLALLVGEKTLLFFLPSRPRSITVCGRKPRFFRLCNGMLVYSLVGVETSLSAAAARGDGVLF